jgi:phage terminase large subunit-like protein
VEGPDRGLRFDENAANRIIDFFGFLRLAEGEHAGRPFVLQPFQQSIVGSLFGWKGSDGYRRFRTGYAEIGKGNGKSKLAGGIGLYGLYVDAYAGYRASERPRQFSLDEENFEFESVESQWRSPDAKYFKVRMTDGKHYLLRYEERRIKGSSRATSTEYSIS